MSSDPTDALSTRSTHAVSQHEAVDRSTVDAMSDTSDLALLRTAFDATEAVIAGVEDGQLAAPTPCDEYDVRSLRDHIVGWLQMFEAWTNGRPWEGDADAYEAVDAPGEFRALADSALAGWEELGVDREIEGMGSTLPADFVLSMMITEYTVHGWDLARATGQEEVLSSAFTDAELERILARGATMLSPEYRGPGKMFGDEVEVPDDAPAIDRLVAFFGRTP
jgi:uncharacterized protein (TIGR03086 family)